MVAAMQIAEKKVWGAAVVLNGDTAPVLPATKCILDPMTLTIERFVIWDLHLSAARSMDAFSDPAFEERSTEPIAVVSAIADQFLGRRQRRQHQCCPHAVAHLSFTEQQHYKPALVRHLCALAR